MKTFKKNNLFLFLILIILISISSLIWNYITLPYNKADILGEYDSNKHHAFNDALRYLLFISLPLAGSLIFKIFYEKKKINLFFLFPNKCTNNKELFYSSTPLVISLFLFLGFLSLSFPISKLDIFHEGQKLSGSFKSLLDNSLWSGSYVTTGIVNEVVGIKKIWQLLGHVSIGGMRYLQIIYILIFKISLIILIYQISLSLEINRNQKIFFVILISFLTFFLIDYDTNTSDVFSYRDLVVTLVLIFYFKYINENQKNFSIYLILISFLNVASFLWSIDRAIVVSFFTIIIIIHILFKKKYLDLFIIISSIIFFWFCLYFYLSEEFYFFYKNTLSILQNQNYLHGIIHPAPFSELNNSTRATKVMILILISILITSDFFFNKKEKYSNNLKIFLISLSAISFLSYIYALGRSDGGHIKQSSGFIILFYLIFIVANLIFFINKNFKKKSWFLFLNIFLTLFLIINLKISWLNISNYINRLNKYIKNSDSFYLTANQNLFVIEAKKKLENANCIQLFTNDAALLYLLKKKSCSRFFFIYSVGGKNLENELLSSIKKTSYIIYSGQTDNWGISAKSKLRFVENYIKENFKKNKKILDWVIKFK